MTSLEIFLGLGLSWAQFKSLRFQADSLLKRMDPHFRKGLIFLFLKRFGIIALFLTLVFFFLVKLKLNVFPFLLSYFISSVVLRYYFWREIHV
ncbi:MAG: hypothetical protein M1169_04220 [Firmicutes bacterium]|nr:hypothetical protein [Bacillota bacterium]